MENQENEIKTGLEDFLQRKGESDTVKQVEPSAIEKLETAFMKDRNAWTAKIMKIISGVKNVSNIPEVQVDMLSERQKLVDIISKNYMILYKLKKTLEEKYKEKYLWYLKKYDYNLKDSEKKSFIRADLISDYTKIEMYETHIDFYKESVKTLDNLGFAIRNRLRVLEENAT